MKIYVFDDKEVNVNQAEEVILSTGNEIAGGYEEAYVGSVYGEQWQKLHKQALYSNQVGNEEAEEEWFEMMFKMIEYAIADVKANGGGIITDLMYHLSPPREASSQPPAGLLVALHAVAHGVPVVICTNAEEVGGHHAKEISWIYDGYVNRLWGKCPFGWVEDKDYRKAVTLLEARASANRTSGI